MAEVSKQLAQNLFLGLSLSDTQRVLCPVSDTNGVKIGIGGCKAVILRMNKFVLNTETEDTPEYFYYGSPKNQNFEVLRGVNSELIFCNSLEEVYVRIPAFSGYAATMIEILIYR